jgi:hypothetical protein
MTNLIVDLLPTDKTIIPSRPDVPVIGKFQPRSTNHLDYALTLVRTQAVMDALKVREYSVVTFYVDECWQGFAIVTGVVNSLDIAHKTEVLVMASSGSLINLMHFFQMGILSRSGLKGGDDSADMGRFSSFTLTNNLKH